MQCTTYDAVLEDAMYDGREEFDDDSRARAVPTVLQTEVHNTLHADDSVTAFSGHSSPPPPPLPPPHPLSISFAWRFSSEPSTKETPMGDNRRTTNRTV